MKRLLLAVSAVVLLAVPVPAAAQAGFVPAQITHAGHTALGKQFAKKVQDNFEESGLFKVVRDGSGLVDLSVVTIDAGDEAAAASVLLKIYKKTNNGDFEPLFFNHYVVVFGSEKVEEQASDLYLAVQKRFFELARAKR
jgi:hypothetical protein